MICSFQGKLGESYNKKLFLSMPLWDNIRYRSLTYYHRSSDDAAKDVDQVTAVPLENDPNDCKAASQNRGYD